MGLPTIVDVHAHFMGGAGSAARGRGGGDYHDQGAGHWIDDHIATPMSKYPQYERSRQSFGIDVLGTLVVEVEADDGTTGFAISTAGLIGCFIVEKHLSRFLIGRRVDDIRLVHDQMINATHFYSGGGGVVVNAISCVDLALWDLFGKVLRQPVYSLLGGAVRDEIRFYATGSRPDLAKEMGFIGGKMPAHFAPTTGTPASATKPSASKDSGTSWGPISGSCSIAG